MRSETDSCLVPVISPAAWISASSSFSLFDFSSFSISWPCVCAFFGTKVRFLTCRVAIGVAKGSRFIGFVLSPPAKLAIARKIPHTSADEFSFHLPRRSSPSNGASRKGPGRNASEGRQSLPRGWRVTARQVGVRRECGVGGSGYAPREGQFAHRSPAHWRLAPGRS